MDQTTKYLLSICMVVIMMGCQKDAPPPPAPVDRVLMVYIAAYTDINIEYSTLEWSWEISTTNKL